MSLKNDFELENTRSKLQFLEDSYRLAVQEEGISERLRGMNLRSLGRMIKQMKEEIIRYELKIRAGTGHG